MKNQSDYTDLKAATPEQILEAAVWFYEQNNLEAENWLRLGFALAQPGGWERVAPYWLRKSQGKANATS